MGASLPAVVLVLLLVGLLPRLVHGETGSSGYRVATQAECDAIWRQAEEVAEQGQHREAADLFVRIYTEYLVDCSTFDGHGPDEALSRSARLFEEDGRYGPAIQVRRRLVSEYGAASGYAKTHPGGSPHAARAVYDIAGNYESIFAFTKAAAYYEQFSKSSTDDPAASLSLRKAISLRIALGQLEEALTDVQVFIASHGREREHRDAVGEVTIEVSDLAGRLERWKTAETQLRLFLQRPPKSTSREHDVVALALHGYALWKHGAEHHSRALESFVKALAIADRDRPQDGERLDRLGRYRQMISSSDGAPRLKQEELEVRLVRLVEAIGRARFHVAEGAKAEYEAIQMPPFTSQKFLSPKVRSWWSAHVGPKKAREWDRQIEGRSLDERQRQIGSVQYQHWVERRFRPWMERKTAALERAEKLYIAAIEEGAPEWSIASTYRLGELSERFMSALQDAPVDPSLDREIIELYRDAIDSAVTPYQDRARGAYRRCLEIARSEKIVNEWSRACTRGLNTVAPQGVLQADTLVGAPDLHDDGFALPQRLLGLE